MSDISSESMDYILQSIKEIKFGQLTLVAQDKRLVQVEKFEKVRLADGKPVQAVRKKESLLDDAARLREVIQEEFTKLSYGNLNIIIQAGSVIQLEKTEKQRFTGMYGEGI